jgi:hypothetical protein
MGWVERLMAEQLRSALDALTPREATIMSAFPS